MTQQVSYAALHAAYEQAVRFADSPHVDLSPLLGLSTPVRIGLADVHEVLEGGEPSFRLEVGAASLTVRRQDGGMVGTFELRW